ncbi:uncharacterized protein LOC119553686 [Drosophila subpulchrella]|uniref:uncharacterized protein LOC119553686 n=1 Tax=Drosophila subpulchrella TaxID=1486046 RepID=UPI0018A1409E|nr:uncharacterized protein LOC119553686 [Drosophila subpulchrella]
MDFVTAISTVGNTHAVAKAFAYAFLKAVNSDPQNWINKVSHQFVGQCFRVLGLNFTISVQAFSQTQDHPYRDDNPNYIFDPVPHVMEELDKFLGILPYMLAQVGEYFVSKGYIGEGFDEATQPISCYLRLVMKWIKVVNAMCANMQLSGSTAVDRFLCEPLARMSFSILCGLTKLLPKYEDFSDLKEICLLLAEDVRYGIFYQDTCSEVVPPMLKIFQKHYKVFCGPKKTALDFVYCILTVVMSESDSYIDAYVFLEAMIKQFAESTDPNSSHYLRYLTNELIDVKYVVLQFGTFKENNSKPLLLATLKYLMTLQSNLASVECFSQRFHEVLLQLVLRMQVSSVVVASLSAELYIKLSQRQHEDRDIAQHILETYIKNPDNPRKKETYSQFRAELTRYLKTLIQHFPGLKEFEFYASVLTARNVRIELSLIAAQSVSILFETHMAEYSTVPEARDQVNEFLRCWPHFIKAQSNQNGTRPVLYSIYSMINFEIVAERDAELLLNLESFFLDNYLNDDTLSESEVYGLYTNISRSVDATGNIQIHSTAARALRDEQSELQGRLNTTTKEGPEMQELLNDYAKSIRRLHGLLMANKLHVRYVVDIYETLAKFVLEMPTQNDNITLYGSESLAAILVLLHDDLRDFDDEMGLRISLLVQQLQDFCVSEMLNANVGLKRAKFMVCSILILHISQLPYSNLDCAAYDKILEILTSPPQELGSESVKLADTYVTGMYYVFRELIKTEQIVFPSNKIWKVLLQYQMCANKMKYLNSEIEQVIGVLMESRIESYVHCIPVIQLHLYNDAKVKKKASVALTAHLKLIDKNSSALDSWLMRLIIFQDSLDLLVKNMRIRRLEATSTRRRNRLLPLQHILILVDNLRLQEAHFMSIAKLVYTLKEEAVGPQEKPEIESFITRISAFKYQAEDEQLEITNNEDYEGKLKALPPGPLNFWQHNALNVSRAPSN